MDDGGIEPSNSESQTSAADTSSCAGCTGTEAGGDTTDFGGGGRGSSCGGHLQAAPPLTLEEAAALGLDPLAELERLGEKMTGTVRWRSDGSETELEVRLRPTGRALAVSWQHIDGTSHPCGCDRVELEVQAELSTADGRLQAAFTAPLSRARYQGNHEVAQPELAYALLWGSTPHGDVAFPLEPAASENALRQVTVRITRPDPAGALRMAVHMVSVVPGQFTVVHDNAYPADGCTEFQVPDGDGGCEALVNWEVPGLVVSDDDADAGAGLSDARMECTHYFGDAGSIEDEDAGT